VLELERLTLSRQVTECVCPFEHTLTPHATHAQSTQTHHARATICTHMPPACTCIRTGAHAQARASAWSSRSSTKRCSCLWSNACGHSSNPKG
jgi:hypothetical protein